MEYITKEQYINNYQLVNKNTKGIVEKKGKFNYLSWGYAEKFLKENYPNIRADMDISLLSKGIIICTLSMRDADWEFDSSVNPLHTEYLAITDYSNKSTPIDKINQNDITFTYQRAFAKAVARYTGYGLALYTDEEFKVLDERLKTTNKFEEAPLISRLHLDIIKNFVKENEIYKKIVIAYCTTINKKEITKFTREEGQELVDTLKKQKESIELDE